MADTQAIGPARWVAENRALLAENERLREALRSIRDLAEDPDGDPRIWLRADAALSEQEAGPDLSMHWPHCAVHSEGPCDANCGPHLSEQEGKTQARYPDWFAGEVDCDGEPLVTESSRKAMVEKAWADALVVAASCARRRGSDQISDAILALVPPTPLIKAARLAQEGK